MDFCLIGYPLGHSFSKKYFTEKFQQLSLPLTYEACPIEEVSSIKNIILENKTLKGFSITIPHKVAIMPLLSQLSEEAKCIGAVNCVKINHTTKNLIGFNTDAYGFEQSLKPLLQPNHTHALILGNGGAAKAVRYVLEKLGVAYKIVTRQVKDSSVEISYTDLSKNMMDDYKLIINSTPLGTFPKVDECPEIPYEYIGNSHLFYDLIYNPEQTLFLQKGKEMGAIIKNGYEMLVLQAERSWEIWNDETL